MSDPESSHPHLHPIRPPTLNSWMHPEVQQIPQTSLNRPSTVSSDTVSIASASRNTSIPGTPGSSQYPSQPHGSVNTQHKDGSFRTKERGKDRSRSKRSDSSEQHQRPTDKSKSKKHSTQPVPSHYDAPTPSATSAGHPSTASFRVQHYMHDNSPPGSLVTTMSTPRTKHKDKTRSSQHQIQAHPTVAQGYDTSPQSRHHRAATQHEADAQYSPQDSADSPGPSVSEVAAMQARSERRDRKSHQQTHDAASAASSSNDYSNTTSSRKKKTPRPTLVLRILTLLIEDMRMNPPDNLLTEVKVPLKEAGDGYWADAKDVCDELQIGPSRIDGPAKVFTMRGKYKQYFLRVTSEGGNDCTPANLRVTPDRTLEIYVEHAPPNTAGMQANAAQMRFQMHTPMSDPIPSRSSSRIAAPRPVAPLRIDTMNPVYDYDEPDQPRSAVPRKRRHSIHPPRDTSPYNHTPYNDPSVSRASYNSRASEMPATSQVTRSSQNVSVSNDVAQRHSSFSSESHTSSDGQTSPDQYASPAYQDTFAMPTEPSLPSPPPARERSQSPIVDAHTAAPSEPTSSFPPPITLAPSSHDPPMHPPTPSTVSPSNRSLSLPGPSAAKKSKQRHRSESATPTPETTPIAPPSGAWGAFSSTPSAFVSTTAASSGSFGFGGTSSSFGASAFGSTGASGAFSKPTGFGTSPFQAAASRLGTSSLSGPPQPSVPSTLIKPTATTSPETDAAVGQYLRAIFSKEPGWVDFVKSRNGVITVSDLIRFQYTYVQSKVERYVDMRVPAGSQPEAAVGVVIAKTHVLKAFNMTPTWGEECSDILQLTTLYGPRGQKYEDPHVVKMMHDIPPVTTGMFAKQYLALLKDIHGRWEAKHP